MDLAPFLSLFVIINPFNVSILVAILVIIVLLICSALISGSEVAFFSISAKERGDLENDKSPASDKVLNLLEKPKFLLANILIANNFINIAIVVISTYIVDNLFDFEGNNLMKFLITVVSVTLLILLMGEVIPKVYATKNSVSLSKMMSSPIKIIEKIFSPLSNLLMKSTSFIDKRIKNKGTEISVNDLEDALEITEIEGVTTEDKKILEGIVKFGNTDVKQIMKSRVDVVAFDKTVGFSDLIPKILESGYSRIPIYDESFDNVSGILYVKDLLKHLDKNSFEWNKKLRPPLFVPESKKIDDLLKQFQESKVHIAIVVDEYGGTSGIITLEDIIEEIIGDITDEFDVDDISYSKLDDNTYVFEGKIALVDLYKVLGITGENFENEKGESDTLAGFLIEQSGKILKKNERVVFENYTFIVEAADKRRIKQIKLTKKNEDD